MNDVNWKRSNPNAHRENGIYKQRERMDKRKKVLKNTDRKKRYCLSPKMPLFKRLSTCQYFLEKTVSLPSVPCLSKMVSSSQMGSVLISRQEK